MNLKAQLRNDLKNKTINYEIRDEIEIISKISGIINYTNVKIIGMYYPINDEPRINAIYDLFKGKQFALPKMAGNNMILAKYRPGENLQIAKGLCFLEPIKLEILIPDIIFVPSVAFDISGYRLGHGGGYYDRYLKSYGNNMLKIGVCFQNKLIDKLPKEEQDIKMDYVVTEKIILKIC